MNELISRRSLIKSSLVGMASFPLLHANYAEAQGSGYGTSNGHRVMEFGDNIIGLSSFSVTSNNLNELSTSSDGVIRIDNGFMHPMSLLLYESYMQARGNPAQGNLQEFIQIQDSILYDLESVVRGILEYEPTLSTMLSDPEVSFFWVRENPIFIVIIVPRSVSIALGFAWPIAYGLRPFVQGFSDETGRIVANRMINEFAP